MEIGPIDADVAKLELTGACDSDYFRLALSLLKQRLSLHTVISFDLTACLKTGYVQVNLNREFSKEKEPGNYVDLDMCLSDCLLRLWAHVKVWLPGVTIVHGSSPFDGLLVKPFIDAKDLGRSTGVVLYQQIADCKFKTFCSKLHSFVSDEGQLSVEIAVAMPKALNKATHDFMSPTGLYFSLIGLYSESATDKLNGFRHKYGFRVGVSSCQGWYFIEDFDLLHLNLDTFFPPTVVSIPLVAKAAAVDTTVKASQPLVVATLSPPVEKDDFVKELAQLYQSTVTKTFLDKAVADSLEGAKTFLRNCALKGHTSASLLFNAPTNEVVILSGGLVHTLFLIPPALGFGTEHNSTQLYQSFGKAIPFSNPPNSWVWAEK